MEQKLTQTENVGVVVGLLKEKNLKFDTTKDGRKYVNGNIRVEVSNEYGISELKIDIMQMEKYANGNDSKAYKRIETVNETYKTIKDHGRENADLVKVGIKIEENNYYSKQDDEIKEGKKIVASTNFDKNIFFPIDKVDANEKQIARMTFGGRINGINRKEDGSLSVDIVGVTYSGKALKHKLEVGKELAGAFEATYFEGCTADLFYMIVDAVELKKVEQTVAFGIGFDDTIERRTRKNIVVGGGNPNANGITQEQMTHMLAMRDAELKDLLETKKNEANNMTQNNNVAFGFGGNQVPTTGFGGSMDNSNPFGMQ